MKKADQYKRKKEALLAIVTMVPGFCGSQESNSNKSWKMYCFLSCRIGESANTEISLRLKKHLEQKSFLSVADFDEYICKINIRNLMTSP